VVTSRWSYKEIQPRRAAPKDTIETYARNTVAGWFRVFRTMTRDAVDTLELARDPTLRIRFPPDSEKDANQLSPDEMLRFLELMKTHFPQQHGLLALLAFTGLRFVPVHGVESGSPRGPRGVMGIDSKIAA
jgi:integrase